VLERDNSYSIRVVGARTGTVATALEQQVLDRTTVTLLEQLVLDRDNSYILRAAGARTNGLGSSASNRNLCES